MKKLKPLLPFLVNVFLVFWPPKNMSSCGFVIYKEEYRFWTFDPTISSQPGMQAFFYSMDFYHKGFGSNFSYTEDELLPEPDEFEENVKAWKAYCNKLSPNNNVVELDIFNILYKTEPTEYFNLYKTLVRTNSFVQFFDTKPMFKKYIEIAKRIEYQCNNWDAWDCYDCPKIVGEGQVVAVENTYSWHDGAVKPNEKVSKQIAKEATVFLHESHNSFLRERFAFQLVRLGFYLQDSLMVANYYNKYLSNLPNSNWIKNAAAMYELNNYKGAEKNVRLVSIFESVPHLRLACEKAFDHALLEASLLLCKTNREKALLLVMHASHKHIEMLPILEQIVELNAANEFIPSLVIREINKLEDWILGAAYTEFGSSKREQLLYDLGWDEKEKVANAVKSQLQVDRQYAQKVYAFLNNNLSKLGSNQSDFFELCLAHLAFINKQVEVVDKHLKNIHLANLNEAGKTQFLVSKLMVSISNSDSVSNESKEDFAKVYTYLLENEETWPQYKNIRYDLCNFMAKECINRGAAAEGFLLYGQSNKPYASHNLMGISNMYTHVYKYAEPNDIIQMLQLLQKPNKSEFEQLVSGNIYEYANDYNEQKLPVSKDKLRDILSMKWVQQDKLKEALLVLKQIEMNYWNNEVYSDFKQDDPFWVSPNDGHDPLNLRGVQYNKVTFLKELIALKTRAQKLSGEAKALILYKIANAYYSMGYAGKYWIMQKNYQLQDREYDNDKDVNPEYYQAQRARYYYKEALKYSSDPKLLALILFALDHGFYEFPGKRDKIVAKDVFKSKSVSPNFYEQLSGNCNLFYELIETYN
ncbi:MAG: hypothetical protein Q8R57_04075 [Bacteroidota bacterium]|nr:hypothetical protein [Bacteroidota bacterium]